MTCLETGLLLEVDCFPITAVSFFYLLLLIYMYIYKFATANLDQFNIFMAIYLNSEHCFMVVICFYNLDID